MKFGKRLRDAIEDMLPEWKDQFLSYKDLKKWLKRSIKTKADETGKEHSDEEKGASEDAKIFVSRVNEELQKFNDFFADKEEDFVIQLRRLADAADRLVARAQLDPPSAATKPFQDELEALLRALVVFHGEMVLLENYSLINYLGLRKILKKHDKLVGCSAPGVAAEPDRGKALSSPHGRRHAPAVLGNGAVDHHRHHHHHGKNGKADGAIPQQQQHAAHPLRVPYLAQILRQPFYTTDLLGQLVAAAEAQYRRLIRLQEMAGASALPTPSSPLSVNGARHSGADTGSAAGKQAEGPCSPRTVKKVAFALPHGNRHAANVAGANSAHACPESAAAPCRADACAPAGPALATGEDEGGRVTLTGSALEGPPLVPMSPSAEVVDGRKGKNAASTSPFHRASLDLMGHKEGHTHGVGDLEPEDERLESEHVLRSTLEALRTLQMFRPRGGNAVFCGVYGVGNGVKPGSQGGGDCGPSGQGLTRRASIDELEAAAACSLGYAHVADDNDEDEDEEEASGDGDSEDDGELDSGAVVERPKRLKISI